MKRLRGPAAVLMALGACIVGLSVDEAAATNQVGGFPQQLVGTWTRTMTAADLRREHDSEFPAGRVWVLTIKKSGAASYREQASTQDPNMVGQIVPAGPNRVHVYISFLFANVYAWRVSGQSLTFTKISESLRGRAAIIVGVWKRK